MVPHLHVHRHWLRTLGGQHVHPACGRLLGRSKPTRGTRRARGTRDSVGRRGGAPERAQGRGVQVLGGPVKDVPPGTKQSCYFSICATPSSVRGDPPGHELTSAAGG